MKEKTIYTDAPADIDEAIENSVRVADFLPSPEELSRGSKKQKITIMLDRRVIDFFKDAARANGGHYQTMMNNLLAGYVDMQSEDRSR